ncbi:MAG: YihY family inner membrane protein [Betaproteobacteria bacterium]|nr:YihY family inner membrane protein [Betaproteobacteria bacterium]
MKSRSRHPRRWSLSRGLHLCWLFFRHLLRRFNAEHFGLLSASLSFTTILSLVPFITLLAALLGATPAFSGLIEQIDRWLMPHLLPTGSGGAIAERIFEFSRQAAQVTLFGTLMMFVTAFLLLQSIEQAFNHIWGIGAPRPLWRRILLYALALVSWPPVIGILLALTSYAVTLSFGFLAHLPKVQLFLLRAISFAVLALLLALLYRIVPNTRVHWRCALGGGFFAAAGFVLMQRLFEIYLAHFPFYTVVYGAFAAIPIFLVWLYCSWAIVLFGALLTATFEHVGAQGARQ